MNQPDSLRDALSRIADVARTAIDGEGGTADHRHHPTHSHDGDGDDGDDGDGHQPPHDGGCLIKSLPTRLLLKAAYTARMINPINAPVLAPQTAAADGFQVDDPQRIAVSTSKYWGPQLRRLTVSFLETTPSDLKARILEHMNAWSKCCGISFAATSGVGDVRISRGAGGYWSYLGTDIQHIPKNRPTMNLQGFTMNTPESEYRRVVRHETGHTLGFPHEHMRRAIVDRIDPAKAYKWFLKTYGWDKATVDSQVLTPLSEASLMSTPPDQTSIMCYQLPAEITRDSKPIVGGTDINTSDCGFAGKIYPKAGRQVVQCGAHAEAGPTEDWPEAEDVEVFA